MSALLTGAVRGVLGAGAAREDGMVPVSAAVIMAPNAWLTRVLYVPEADMQRFVPGARFVWALVEGEAHVAAVGRDADDMLRMVAA